MEKILKIKEIFFILFLTFNLLLAPVFAENYIPNQEAVKIIEDVKQTVAGLSKDFSQSSATVDSLIIKCEEMIKMDEKYVDAYVYLSLCYLLVTCPRRN